MEIFAATFAALAIAGAVLGSTAGMAHPNHRIEAPRSPSPHNLEDCYKKQFPQCSDAGGGNN